MAADLFDLLIKRTSVRSYLDKPIEKEKEEKLIQVINASPTSTNSHDFSAIIIRDKELLKEITLGLSTQDHIYKAPMFVLFLADLNLVKQLEKTHNKQLATNNLNQLLCASGDAFISCSMLHATALSLGLDCCYIGFLRKSQQLLIDRLNIKGQALPIIGLTIGYAQTINEVKPKLNKVFFDQYDISSLPKKIEEYDKTMLSYYDSRSTNKKYFTWSEVALKIFESDTYKIDDLVKKVWDLK